MMYVEGEDRSAALFAAMIGVILFNALFYLLVTRGFSWVGMKEDLRRGFYEQKRRFDEWWFWKKKYGFTLIELAIVLAIIALIVGGVLVGQDLIKAARVRGTISELDRIKVAVTTFKLKYDCLPGDCSNITAFFPQDALCPNPNVNWGAKTTCNGDGDGIINSTEMMFFFEHLSLAGLINQSIGLPNVAGYPSIPVFSSVAGGPPQNSYVSSYYGHSTVAVNSGDKAAGFAIISPSLSGSLWNYFMSPPAVGAFPSNFSSGGYLLGGDSGNGINYVPVMTAGEAFAIDTKIDDGNPATGSVQAMFDGTGGLWPYWGLPYCYTSRSLTAQYNLTYSQSICTLWFAPGF